VGTRLLLLLKKKQQWENVERDKLVIPGEVAYRKRSNKYEKNNQH
jgi:hypothetical protein